MLRLNKNEEFINPYNINEEVEFFNYQGKWVKGVIVDFKITDYVYKAVIKCENKECRFHYVCICSFYLRKFN
jgi:hypothetical protein